VIVTIDEIIGYQSGDVVGRCHGMDIGDLGDVDGNLEIGQTSNFIGEAASILN
jgi:hypothetical protein